MFPEIRRPGMWRSILKSHQPLDIGTIERPNPKPVPNGSEQKASPPPVPISIGNSEDKKAA